MRRAIIAIFALCCAVSVKAQAQTITVFHAFTPGAMSYLNSIGKTPAQYIQEQVYGDSSGNVGANGVLSGSNAGFSFITPANPQYLSFQSPQEGTNAAYWGALNSSIAGTRDVTGSDMVIVVSDFGSGAPDELPGLGALTRFDKPPYANSPAATAVVNVRSANSNYMWLHAVLTTMGTQHQRADPDHDLAAPMNHGFVIKGGSDAASCYIRIDVTSSRTDLDHNVIVPSCSGWGLQNPGPGQVGFYCEAAGWCSAWSQTQNGHNGYDSQGYTAFQGSISGVDGQGNPICAITALTPPPPPQTRTQVNGSNMGAATQGPNGITSCQNVFVVPRIAGANVTDPGTGRKIGDPFNDQVAYLQGVYASMQQRHTVKRGPVAAQLLDCVSGKGC